MATLGTRHAWPGLICFALLAPAGCALPATTSDFATAGAGDGPILDGRVSAGRDLARGGDLDGAAGPGDDLAVADGAVDAAIAPSPPDLAGAACVHDSDCAGGRTCCNQACVDVRSDARNCSACGHACGGASPDCCAGACTDLGSDALNCGACGAACSTANGAPSCSGRQCSWQCMPGWAHCQGGNTGCDTATTTVMDCGGCGNACNPANATHVSCDGTTCAYACKPGYADCVTTAPDTDGCATDLSATGQKLCGAACAMQSSCCSSADCGSPPGPAACYQAGACSGPGGSCSYPQLGGSQVCGATCCLPSNGTCKTNCTLNCASGFCDSDGNRANGCEAPTNTTANCGGCGNACDTTSSTGASCNGASCLYAGCRPSRVDCNKTAPDTDGCECAGTGCCAGSTCQTVHQNGLGQSFYDCAALGTYNVAEATAACVAHTGSAGQCARFNCMPQSGTTIVDGVVCDNNGAGANCHCWDYSIAGHTGDAAGSIDSACLCPFTGETPMWN